jgi:hypothetical protein
MVATMFSELVMDLTKAYGQLESCCKNFGDAVRQDEGFPVFVFNQNNEMDFCKERAIGSATRRWRSDIDENEPISGIICCSENSVEQVIKLNDAKDLFKNAVSALKEKDGAYGKSRIDKLIDKVLKTEGRRNEELSLALQRVQIGRLDLLKCYSQIRILPKEILSVRWTWAKKHRAIISLSVKDGLKMADNLENPKAKEIALNILSRMNIDDKLAFKKTLKNQLKANIKWLEDDSMKRDQLPISGILVSRNPMLPQDFKLPNMKSQETRVKRSDKKIDDEILVKALNLHKYSG